MARRIELHADVRELIAVAALPSIYMAVAPFVSVRPVHDPASTVGGALMFMVIVIGLWGVWDLRPRRAEDGRWRLPGDGGSLTRRMLNRILARRRHWLRGLLLMAFAMVFLDVYAAYKQAIPRFADYTWDPLLSDLDRIVHGGAYPWRLLEPLVESPRAVVFLDRIYWAWFAVTLGFVALMAWSWERQRRIRFMLTFFATWIVGGTLLAIAFASGGPVYFHHFAPDVFNPYEPLIRTLHDMDGVQAVRAHHVLWTGFSTGGHPRASGISAMPSLHVAMATLCVLAAWTFNRTFGWITSVYGALIVVGSVVLGWHYAIDAYVSIVLVLILWWVAGRLALARHVAGRPGFMVPAAPEERSE